MEGTNWNWQNELIVHVLWAINRFVAVYNNT